MKAFGRQHYVGSLRTKQGEFDAVRDLSPDVRERFTPLWQLQPSGAYEFESASAPVDAIFHRLPAKIHRAANGLDGFVDGRLIDPRRRHSSGEHPLRRLCRLSEGRGTRLTPVVWPDSDSSFISAACAVNREFETDLAVRVTIPQISAPAHLVAFLSSLDVPYDRLHLMIDCEHLTEVSAAIFPTVLPPLLRPLLTAGAWKTVTLLSGSFPDDFSALPPGRNLLPRLEWSLWLTLAAAGVLSRRPAFGDYGIGHPVYRHLRKYSTGGTKIRYTGLSNYYVFRGRTLKNPRFGGYRQFHELAAQLVADPVYRGASYSAGDRYIADCAENRAGSGNLQTWITVGAVQHATYMARLLPAIE